MYRLSTRGLGDIASDAAALAVTGAAAASTPGFFDASCPPGSPGCVPHWYCYIPGMVTPDCVASLAQGVKEAAGAVGTTVGETVGSAVAGTTQGIVQGILNPQGVGPNGAPTSSTNWALYVGLAAAAAFALMAFGGGSARRYGR